MTLSNGEKLSLDASGGAEISFKDDGKTTVTLDCNALFSKVEMENT